MAERVAFIITGIFAVVGVLAIVGGASYALFRAAVRRGGRGIGSPDPLAFLPEKTDRSRCLCFEGIANARDLGGLKAGEKARVAEGLVLRTGHWGRATEADLGEMAARGVKTVLDLRGKTERDAHPDRLPPGALGLWIPLFEEGQGLKGARSTVLFHRDRLSQLMERHYRHSFETRAPMLGEVLRLFADPGRLPLAFHCTAGKDRAGIVAALLLATLGVEEQAILEDYALSNLAFDAIASDPAMALIAKVGVELSELGALFVADPAWLSGSLAWIRATWGSVEAYLLSACHLGAEELVAIRRNLLVEA